jgi:putative DNA methylase
LSVYLALAVDRLVDRQSTIASWDSSRDTIRNTFVRQAIPMTWTYAEGNPFSSSSGSFESLLEGVVKAIAAVPSGGFGSVGLADAQKQKFAPADSLISTDPPYYDNVIYADLADFFYVWLRRSLSHLGDELFRRILTPKDEELVVIPHRHGGREGADAFFLQGMTQAIASMRAVSGNDPITIYYAFKQSEIARDGLFSPGWSSFLQALIDAGMVVDATWPIRTELMNRASAIEANSLSSSIVLVCRKRADYADVITRADLIRALKKELPIAIDAIRKAGVGPVDMQQSVIGPGMGVFSRHAKVLEDDDSNMPVKTALALINRVWEEIENELDQAFDAETQVALAWFATYGFDARASGELITLANAKNIGTSALFVSGVFKDLKGKTALTPRDELPKGWTPASDKTLTVWECVQHTARILNAEDGGGAAAGLLVAEMGPKAAEARALAYRLFEIATQKGWAAEALIYNELAQEWPKLEDLASTADVRASTATAQAELF